MTVVENSVEIARPPEVAFDYLSDMRNELKWNPDCQRMEKVTDGPVGLGTRFRAKWRASGVVEAECLRYDRPRGWTYLNGGPVEVRLDVDLTPTPAGTRLVSRFDAKPRGWFHLVFPIFLLVIRRQEKTNMANAKRAVEAL